MASHSINLIRLICEWWCVHHWSLKNGQLTNLTKRRANRKKIFEMISEKSIKIDVCLRGKTCISHTFKRKPWNTRQLVNSNWIFFICSTIKSPKSYPLMHIYFTRIMRNLDFINVKHRLFVHWNARSSDCCVGDTWKHLKLEENHAQFSLILDFYWVKSWLNKFMKYVNKFLMSKKNGFNWKSAKKIEEFFFLNENRKTIYTLNFILRSFGCHSIR